MAVHVFGRRAIVLALLAAAIAALLAVALWPRPEPVELVRVSRGQMRVTVQDEGRTRVRELYTVAAPISGELERIDLEAGDRVAADATVVARIHPSESPFLDPRSEAVARARVDAAVAAVDLARAQLERVEAQLAYALQELDRAEYLAGRGDVSQSRLDEERTRVRAARADVGAAEATLRLRREELAQARANLTQPRPRLDDVPAGCCVEVTAPVSGRVLRVDRESAGPVVAGEPLLVLGDPGGLEVVVDLLSTDAVKVQPGAEAEIAEWGGDWALAGTVRRVEPYGFTEVSALGIEEQRVNVVIDVDSRDAARARLGHGFRVEPRITVWQAGEALRLPLGGLFRAADGSWAVFVAEGGRARLRRIAIGHTNAEVAEVLDGLSEGERVVLYPGDRIGDGTRIRAPE